MQETLAVGERFSTLHLSRFFERRSLRQRVALSQLPLTVVILIIALSAASVHPDLLRNWIFQLSLVLHAALFILCLAIPWERLRQGSYLFIPVADFLAIGVSHEGANDTFQALSLLAIFPVIWLSASGILPRLSVVISVAGSWLIVLVPLLEDLPEVTVRELIRTLPLPIAMLIVALAIRFASSNLLLQQAELKAKDAELRRLLDESNDRERLLNSILEAVDVGVMALDSEGRHILMNRQQQLFHHLATPDGATGLDEKTLSVYGPDRKTPVPPERRPLQKAANGETYSGYLIWLGEGADQRAVSVTAQAVMDHKDDFAGSVLVFSDVTEMVEAISAKDEFVSTVSHEFRTPLTSILGYLDLALDEEDQLPKPLKQYLGTARRNAERLLALVSDLLLSTATSMSIHPRPSNLKDLVDLSISSSRAHADRAGVLLLNEVPDCLWAHADPIRIGQVLDNLLSNAIKYSPDGGVVTLDARESDGCVELHVTDNGMGMTKEDAAMVFSRFFRTSEARQSAIPGAGLGLSITKTIVEGHNGSISCNSSPGAGTTFTVNLPTVPAPVEPSLRGRS